ncbi:MAG: TMEM175 family protein [Thaumarchaeota archaeon]|nr:TMEM175 family protein [Nitrososphaerota archaeon]
MPDASGSPITRIKIRIESLSDLVFGLALSIGSIILVGKLPQNGQDLAVNVLLFGFSFLIIVMTWLGYSRTMTILPVEVPFALFLNIVLLFCVAIEPYLFYVVQSAQTLGVLDAGSVAYALDVGPMFLVLSALCFLLLKEERVRLSDRRVHPAVLARFRRFMFAQLIVGAIFVASALPVFWVNTPIGFLRFDLWYSSFTIFFIIAYARRPKTTSNGHA